MGTNQPIQSDIETVSSYESLPVSSIDDDFKSLTDYMSLPSMDNDLDGTINCYEPELADDERELSDEETESTLDKDSDDEAVDDERIDHHLSDVFESIQFVVDKVVEQEANLPQNNNNNNKAEEKIVRSGIATTPATQETGVAEEQFDIQRIEQCPQENEKKEVEEDGEEEEEESAVLLNEKLMQAQIDEQKLVIDFLSVKMNELKQENDELQRKSNEVEEMSRTIQNLKLELDSANETIADIEIEAEQQYNDLKGEMDHLCGEVMAKQDELDYLKEKMTEMSLREKEMNEKLEDKTEIVESQTQIIGSLKEELVHLSNKIVEVTKQRDQAQEEAARDRIKAEDRKRFLEKEAQMSLEIENLQREVSKQKIILSNTSMAKLAESFERKIIHLENEIIEKNLQLYRQKQIINGMNPAHSEIKKYSELPSAGSSSDSFQHGLDQEAKEAIFSFLMSDRHNQLANIYNIGRILDLTSHKERTLEKYLSKDRFA